MADVQRLIDDGWSVIPIPAGSKKGPAAWNTTDYTAADFTADDGVAGRCGSKSGHRTCVDHDTDAAVTAATFLLPLTRVEGRASRPDSHAWFACPDAKHTTFKHLRGTDGKERIIVEILTNGQYALLPPSVHPSGEPRVWSNTRPFLDIDFADLFASVRAVAVASLVAEHFPGSGGRHNARLALAGYLKRVGLTHALARQIGLAVEAIIHGDPQDWDGAVNSTFGTSAPTTGGPKLAEELDRGPEVLGRLNRWFGKRTERGVRFTAADTITPQPVHWFWDQRVPSGSFGLLAGREGLGKSLTALSLVAQLTRGTLDGIHLGSPKSVIICATEDSWAHVIVPRLMAADADLSRVMRVEVETTEGLIELSLPADFEGLKHAILERGDIALLLLDPLISRLDGKLDTHKDAEVRRALEPLGKLADDTGTAIIGIIHVNKSVTSDPLNSVMGSRAFSAFARFVLFVVEDPNDDSVRLFGQPKNNLGPTNLNTLTFEIVEQKLTIPAGEIHIGRVQWTGFDPRSIREILQEGQAMKAPTAGGEATRWLKQFLEHRNGLALSSVVMTDGQSAGHHPRALQRAAKKLRVSFHPMGMPAKVWWVLPGAQLPLVTP